MKKLGIIGAMAVEIAALKDAMQDVKTTCRTDMEFYEGKLEGLEVVVVQCGIGGRLVDGSAHHQLMVAQQKGDIRHELAVLDLGTIEDGSIQLDIIHQAVYELCACEHRAVQIAAG